MIVLFSNASLGDIFGLLLLFKAYDNGSHKKTATQWVAVIRSNFGKAETLSFRSFTAFDAPRQMRTLRYFLARPPDMPRPVVRSAIRADLPRRSRR